MWDIAAKRRLHEANAESVRYGDMPHSSRACSKSKLAQRHPGLSQRTPVVDRQCNSEYTTRSGQWHSTGTMSQSEEVLDSMSGQSSQGSGPDDSSALLIHVDSTCKENQLSALQHTLVSCGRLRVVDDRHTRPMEEHVSKALAVNVKQSKTHAKWLQRHKKDNTGGGHVNVDDDGGVASVTTMPTFSESGSNSRHAGGGLFKALPSTESKSGADITNYRQSTTSRENPLRHRRSRDKVKKGSALEEQSSCLYIDDSRPAANGSEGSKKGGRSSVSDNKKKPTKGAMLPSYDDSLADHLNVTTSTASGNPFRMAHRDASRLKFGAAQSLDTLHSKHVDPKTYSDAMYKTQYGSYNVMVKEPVVGGVPSKENITRSLVQISRRVLVCYDTKIVETGAALRVSRKS